jgi:CubicO group peptidase (beta-lactamase class C family)
VAFGKTLTAIMQDEIFDPLEMRGAGAARARRGR